jgi:hypothetical protein
MEKYSQVGQDLIVLEYLQYKKNGFFLDIGCGSPTIYNNTFLLEKDYSWTGLSIDIEDLKEGPFGWKDIRATPKLIQDALQVDYSMVLSLYNAPKVIDYLSMDLEPPTLTFECLYKIPFDTYTFNFISFETDEGRDENDYRKNTSRAYLKSKGYHLLGNLHGQDDLYIHTSLKEITETLSFYDTLLKSGTGHHIIELFNPELTNK